MLVRSNMVPDGVQTGCEKGWSEREQKLNGRRLKPAFSPPRLAFPTPAPALAEYASSDAHSECVIYGEFMLAACDTGVMKAGKVWDIIRKAYPFLTSQESVVSVGNIV